MAHEKEISTSVEKHLLRKPVLHMKLLVPRDTLAGYELALLQKLFFGERTNSIMDRYINPTTLAALRCDSSMVLIVISFPAVIDFVSKSTEVGRSSARR